MFALIRIERRSAGSRSRCVPGWCIAATGTLTAPGMWPSRRTLPSKPWNSAGPRASTSSTSGAPRIPRTSAVVTCRLTSSRGVNVAGVASWTPPDTGQLPSSHPGQPPSSTRAASNP